MGHPEPVPTHGSPPVEGEAQICDNHALGSSPSVPEQWPSGSEGLALRGVADSEGVGDEQVANDGKL